MREHVGLFRGKRLEDGKWIEGSLVRAEDAVFISAKPKCYATCFTSVKDVGSFTEYSISWFFRVDPDTVCECTGLTDKNGKLIFEGDILKYGHPNWNNSAYLGVVNFYAGCFCVKEQYERKKCSFNTDKDGKWHVKLLNSFWSNEYSENNNPAIDIIFEDYPERVEVIGNIHDNQDLIGGNNNDKI